jgi:hypothetical protein
VSDTSFGTLSNRRRLRQRQCWTAQPIVPDGERPPGPEAGYGLAKDDSDMILRVRLAWSWAVESAPVLKRVIDPRAQLETVMLDQDLQLEARPAITAPCSDTFECHDKGVDRRKGASARNVSLLEER